MIEIDPVVLAEQEHKVADKIIVTAMPGFAIANELGITPGSLNGQTVLDIASGGSDFTAWAASHGANAHAIDPAYADRDTLEHTLDDEANEAAKFQSRVGMAAARRKDYEIFVDTHIGALRQHMEATTNYVAGSSLALPYRDKTFDRVITHSFLTSGVGMYREFTIASIVESLRVLRPRGVFHVGPILTNVTALVQSYDHRVVEANIREGHAYAVEQGLAAKKMRKLCVDKTGWMFQIEAARR